MRLVFAGTPAPAVPSLQALLASSHDVVAVLTRPDAPAGRGRQVRSSPVATVAREAGIEVLTPARPREPEFLDRLAALAVDCCPVVAYGALIPPAALAIPRHGWVNLHFSLLPAWRGAAPVQHALLHGDEVTGASVFQLEAGLDTGPVYGTVTEPIGPADTTGDLLGRLSRSGADLLRATLDGIERGDLQAVSQPAEGVSLAPRLDPVDVRVDWSAPAVEVDRLVRAATPAPGPWTIHEGRRLKLGPVRPLEPAPGDGASGSSGGGDPVQVPAGPGGQLSPGEIRAGRDAVLVGTGTHPVQLGEVQPEGRAAMSATDWARGARLEPGTHFS